MFYRLFLEYHGGVEREVLVGRYEEYFVSSGTDAVQEEEGEDQGRDPRVLSSLFLRKLISYGWMSEEERPDFTRIINLSSQAKPFFDALDAVARGLSVEYESHIVAVYSSLCSDSARENGEHAVLNAHYHTRLLIESLKVLEQNIKGYIQEMYQGAREIKDILHVHYDIYMNEVVDKAYNRLKTSDNLSKYRPKVTAAIAAFQKDDQWIVRTASRLSVIKRISVEESVTLVRTMLREIRDDLRSIDPLLEEIDDKNRRYSRISTERIKAKLYNDTTLQGKIRSILTLWREESLPDEVSHRDLAHRVFRERFPDQASLFVRRIREFQGGALLRPPPLDFEHEKAEAELRLRLGNQLSPAKIAAFLSQFCTEPGISKSAEAMVNDMDSFVKLLYAALYAEKKSSSFPYDISWENGRVEKGMFRFRKHSFVRRYPDA